MHSFLDAPTATQVLVGSTHRLAISSSGSTPSSSTPSPPGIHIKMSPHNLQIGRAGQKMRAQVRREGSLSHHRYLPSAPKDETSLLYGHPEEHWVGPPQAHRRRRSHRHQIRERVGGLILNRSLRPHFGNLEWNPNRTRR